MPAEFKSAALNYPSLFNLLPFKKKDNGVDILPKLFKQTNIDGMTETNAASKTVAPICFEMLAIVLTGSKGRDPQIHSAMRR